MVVVVDGFGLLIVLVGVAGFLFPAALVTLVERAWSGPIGFSLGVAFRTVLGVVFLLAAADTRFPWVVGALGVLSLMSALGIMAMGQARMKGNAHWWAQQPTWLLRLSLVAAFAFGGFLIYASA